MTTTFRFFLLGPAELQLDEQTVSLKSTKALAMLAYLALAQTPQSREHLTDLLWPDSQPEAGRKNLRNTLWAIRKALGDELLLAETDRMALADTVWLDVRVFEETIQTQNRSNSPDASALQTAIDLYRAPFLDGLNVADAPDFELWLSTQRERFGQMYLRALEARIGLARRRQDWQEVIRVARRALAADNLQEPVYRSLMEAHAYLGERAEALRQYDALRSTLAYELGVDPLPETEQLREAILNGQLSPAALPDRGVMIDAPLRARPEAAKSAVTPFVGREAEQAALNQALAQADRGQLQVVLISGELGIGKSRLWQVWSSGLPDPLTVLETRCLDTTQSLPFAPLTGLFGKASCAEKLFRPNSPVSPIWLSELVRLLPEIKQHLPELPPPPSLPAEEEHRRLFEAFAQILRAIDSRPLLLFIDDLHWVDRSTLDWLVYLVDRLHDEPLLLVGTYRPSEAPAQLSQVAANWNRQGVLRRLPLSQLTPDETAQLVKALGRGTEHIDLLQTQSAGNPYFLIELSQAEPGDTPPGLAELIRARLNRLPEAVRQVLQAAAVLDSGFDFATLRRTSGRGEEETLNALDALLAAAVLAEQNGGYDFAHPLVAVVVRNDLSLARRSFLNRRAAEALEATHPNRLEAIAGQLAGHYARAGRPAQAAQYAELAGRRAMELAAPAEAVALYQEAMKLEPTPGRRAGLAQAILFQGSLEEARRAFRQAAAEFEAGQQPVKAARTYLELAMSHMPSGQGDQVIHWAETALATLGSQQDAWAQAQAHHLLAAGGLLVGQSLAKAEAHLQVAIELATDNDLPDLAGAARFELGNLLAQRGQLSQALQSFEAAINFARLTDNLFQQVLGHNNLAYHLMLAGDLRQARQHIEAALELAERHSLFVPRQYLYSTRGEIALAEGAFDEAEQWFGRALVEADRNHNRLLAANIQANQGLVARERGQLDEALLLLREACESVAPLPAPHLQPQIDLWLAELYLLRGENTAAAAALSQAETRLAGSEREGLKAWASQVRQALDEKK